MLNGGAKLVTTGRGWVGVGAGPERCRVRRRRLTVCSGAGGRTAAAGLLCRAAGLADLADLARSTEAAGDGSSAGKGRHVRGSGGRRRGVRADVTVAAREPVITMAAIKIAAAKSTPATAATADLKLMSSSRA